jgi:glycosyltransferase involved in cell wall biosynthesis
MKLSELASNKHKQLENKVLNTADLILVTSPSTRAEFKQITSQPIEVITNGYDVEKIGNQIVDKKFSLAHIGSFLSERNPRILWESISELIRENPLFASHFQLKLIGAVSQEVLDSIALFQLQNYVLNLGYVSHDEAIVHQKKSQVLLLIEINSEDTKSIIPGKLFEYMVSERPIIGVGPKGCDFSEILIDTNTGVFADYSEKEKLKNYIANYFSLFLEGNLKSNAVGLQKYSRRNLTEKLVGLLKR